MRDPGPLIRDPAPLAEEESLGGLVTRVVDDAKAFVRAEVALYREEAGAALGEAKWLAVMAAAALILAIGGGVLLLIAAVLALGSLIGDGWAALVVALASLGVAGLLGWLAAKRARAAFTKIGRA